MQGGPAARLRRPVPRSHRRPQRDAMRAAGRPRSRSGSALPTRAAARSTTSIRGEVSVDWSTISDFVIVRSNGTPVFFLANAVDDVDMGITHVLRGEDLIDSTHRVLALRRALGHDDQPVYAHLPLILGPAAASCRSGTARCRSRSTATRATSPVALVNYLALLGWGPEDGREVLERRRAGRRVRSRPRQARRPPTFDAQEARVDERRAHPPPPASRSLAGEVLPFAKARYGDAARHPRVRERRSRSRRNASTTLVQIADQAAFLFVPDDELEIDAGRGRSDRQARAGDRRARRGDRARRDAASGRTTASTCVPAARSDSELKPARHMQVLYTAIEGRTAGLPLFDSIEMLGRESALHRLRRAHASGCRADETRVQDRVARRARALHARLRLPLGDVRPGVAGRAARRRPPVGRDRRARRRAVRRPAVAGARRRGSTTRSTCTDDGIAPMIVVTGGQPAG